MYALNTIYPQTEPFNTYLQNAPKSQKRRFPNRRFIFCIISHLARQRLNLPPFVIPTKRSPRPYRHTDQAKRVERISFQIQN